MAGSFSKILLLQMIITAQFFDPTSGVGWQCLPCEAILIATLPSDVATILVAA